METNMETLKQKFEEELHAKIEEIVNDRKYEGRIWQNIRY